MRDAMLKQTAISCLTRATYFGGATGPARRLSRRKIPILTYHSVSAAAADVSPSMTLTRMSVPAREFRRQMEYVARHYRVVTFDDLRRARAGEAELPPSACVITFDDGYLDAYENAVPVLSELGLTATFFVIGRTVAGRGHPWLHAVHEIIDTTPAGECAAAFARADPALPPASGSTRSALFALAWDYFLERSRPVRQRFLDHLRADLGPPEPVYRFMEPHHLRKLRDRGFEIGSHSMEHELMSRLSDADLRTDVSQGADALLTILGGAPTLFCYPFGDFDGRLLAILEREGFAYACTTAIGLNDASTNRLTLHRIGVYSDTDFPRFVVRLAGLEGASRTMYQHIKSALAGRESHP